MILFFCSWKNERKIENFGGDCDTRVRIFLLSSFAIALLPQLRHSRVADHGVLPQSLATASSGIFLFTTPGVLVALLIVTILSWCPFCIENTKCWPSLATIGSNDAQRLSEHFLSHLCPKQRWCFFFLQKMRFCVRPLFRSYTLTYLGPTGQSPACQSSQVVPFLRLLKEKVRESQASIESVEANSLCLLKVLESGGKPTLLNRCLENGSN